MKRIAVLACVAVAATCLGVATASDRTPTQGYGQTTTVGAGFTGAADSLRDGTSSALESKTLGGNCIGCWD
jgi:hypothetical protein